jgi:small subunit ribosomal protein S6
MNHYETMLIVKPTLTDEETRAQIDKTIAIITDHGGEIVATKEMGMRRLAYPIAKHERGHYTVIYFRAPGSLIAELERQMRYNEDILKFMTIKYVNKKEIAQFEKQTAALHQSAQPSAQDTPKDDETTASEDEA